MEPRAKVGSELSGGVHLEERLEGLGAEIAALRARLEALEDRLAAGVGSPTASPPPPPLPIAPPVEAPGATPGAVGHLALIGRTLVVLGGAYLLRGIAQAHVVTPTVGAALGLAYASVLLLLADREARRSAMASAGYYGFIAMAITFPMLAELTLRHHLLGPAPSAALIALFGGAGLTMAWRRSLAPLAWFTALFQIATLFVLMRLTGALLPYTVALFCLAAAAEALAFDDRWLGLRWPAAFALDVAVLWMAALAVRPEGLPPGFAAISLAAAVATQLALPVLYTATVGVRTIVRGRVIRIFGILQGPFALLIGLWGAARLLAHGGADTIRLGVTTVALAVATYAVAFIHGAARPERRRNYYFYATIALLLTLAGLTWLLSGAALAVAFALLAVAAVAVGIRRRVWTLRLHGAALLVAAATAGGLLQLAGAALTQGATEAWTPIGAGLVVAALAALTAWALLLAFPEAAATDGRELVPRLLVATLAVTAIAAFAVALPARLVAAAPGPAADAGLLAALRTMVLSSGAVALAWLSRYPRAAELRLLAPPLLVACGLKLFVEDFPVGRALTQTLSFVFYGAALILGPRLLRRPPTPSSEKEVTP